MDSGKRKNMETPWRRHTNPQQDAKNVLRGVNIVTGDDLRDSMREAIQQEHQCRLSGRGVKLKGDESKVGGERK